MNAETHVGTTEAARLLQISRQAVHRGCVEGRIPYERPGREYLIPRSWLPKRRRSITKR